MKKLILFLSCLGSTALYSMVQMPITTQIGMQTLLLENLEQTLHGDFGPWQPTDMIRRLSRIFDELNSIKSSLPVEDQTTKHKIGKIFPRIERIFEFLIEESQEQVAELGQEAQNYRALPALQQNQDRINHLLNLHEAVVLRYNALAESSIKDSDNAIPQLLAQIEAIRRDLNIQ